MNVTDLRPEYYFENTEDFVTRLLGGNFKFSIKNSSMWHYDNK